MATEDERFTRPFAAVLEELQRGKTARELADLLQQAVEAVEATHKPATLTLVLKVSKSKMAGALEIDDKVSVKLPAGERSTSLFYVDKHKNVVRDDPRQMELPVGPVRIAPPSAVSE